LAVSDTLKRATPAGQVADTIARDGLWRAQTPQAFRFEAIYKAHQAARGLDLTDDAAVAERAGLRVVLVEGDERNLKITTAGDLARAARLVAEKANGIMDPNFETRIGSGFDVHRFGPGDKVMICGVAVPHDHGVIAHSDGDVGLHALVDALLGALGEGDIGQYFPPSDPQWRGVDSARFVAEAVARVRARGGRIANADLTILCESPKIGPHRKAMTERVARLLGVETGRVNIKATTTETLGFTGRREGLAAQAVACLLLPVSKPSP
jgi:2-C-methyl-D-erythritol 4-phosphate cytidylyltransferase/2-C-methyl-D-erythritol 2,4-cyclodiphosphate synthase